MCEVSYKESFKIITDRKEIFRNTLCALSTLYGAKYLNWEAVWKDNKQLMNKSTYYCFKCYMILKLRY